MFIDIGADWNHLLVMGAIAAVVVTGVLALVCAAAGLCGRALDAANRKPERGPRILV